jgi:hypothetical protein
MIHENTDRLRSVSAGVRIPAVWMGEDYQTRARCPFCAHVVELPTSADEH